MKRRPVPFPVVPTTLTILIASSLFCAAPVRAISSSRPNILIILTDDQRWATSMRVMPATRRLFGAKGTRFPNAYATTPLCCPSRATIFTGRYAHNHGVWQNRPGRAFDQQTTVQRYLHDAGYRTGIFGKYFNHWNLDNDPPYFDRWAIDDPSPDSNGYVGGTWNVGGDVRAVQTYSTDFIATRGEDFVDASESHDDQPWFLELAPFAPHEYAQPAPRYADAAVPSFRQTPAMTEADRSDKPPFVRRVRPSPVSDRAAAAARQLRTLSSVDDLVRNVFAALRRDGEAHDTLAFFLSDNGACWGEHGLIDKEVAYPCSSRVPMYARWPGRIDARATDGRLVGTLDITPTIYDAAGVTPEAEPDGMSLLQDRPRGRLLLEFHHVRIVPYPSWASTITRRFQYIEAYRPDGTIAFREYYDLRADPWELTNVLHDGDGANDPSVGPLHRQLAADRTCSGATCP